MKTTHLFLAMLPPKGQSALALVRADDTMIVNEQPPEEDQSSDQNDAENPFAPGRRVSTGFRSTPGFRIVLRCHLRAVDSAIVTFAPQNSFS